MGEAAERQAAMTAAVERWLCGRAVELLGCEIGDPDTIGFDSISAERRGDELWVLSVDGYVAAGARPHFGAELQLRKADGDWTVADAAFAKGKLVWVCTRYPWQALYFGSVRDGVRDGVGCFRSEEGEQYEGEWRAGKRHGWGRYVYQDGGSYLGRWRGGLMECAAGVYHMHKDGGEWYVGGFADGCKHGAGLYSNAAAGRYALQHWEQGKLVSDASADAAAQVSWYRRLVDTAWECEQVSRHGADVDDVPTIPADIEEEFGSALDTKEHTFPSGATYTGEFLAGTAKRHGRGKWSHPEGDVYEGQFSRNKREGWGVYYSKSIDRRYIGSWRADKMDGWGVLVMKGGARCVGRFSDDQRTGLCVQFDAAGQVRLQRWVEAELKEEKEAGDGDALALAYAGAEKALREAVRRYAPSAAG